MERELTSPRRLRWLMEVLGWQPAGLAEKAGYAPSTVRRFLRGSRDLSDAARIRLLGAIEEELAARREKIQELKALAPPSNGKPSRKKSERPLAVMVLTEALRYAARHQDGQLDDEVDQAITQELEPWLDGVHPPIEVAKALGTYLARLEINLAKAQRRIAELETQQLPPQDDAVPEVVEVA